VAKDKSKRGDGRVEELKARIAQLRAYHGTREGKIATAVAQPMIDYLQSILERSVVELARERPGMSMEQIQHYLSECRGELRAWKAVRDGDKVLAELAKAVEKIESSISKMEEKVGATRATQK
jgi:hypothetical protein